MIKLHRGVTGATLFSGFGGADLGMEAAGIEVLWGLDNAPQIVAAAQVNGLPVICADILTADPRDFALVDFLHASPPCPAFSSANINKGETAADIALAEAICRFIVVLHPRFFVLENVPMYRKSASFEQVIRVLGNLGYMLHWSLVNFADLGVPQTRRRLILRAVRGGLLPELPPPVPWRGWYQAVADLLPGLPDTQFAPWQIARGVLEAVRETAMVAQGSFDHEGGVTQPLGMRRAAEPAFTITGNSNMNGLRCLLVSSQNGRVAANDDTRKLTVRRGEQPAFTITADMTRGRPRAFIVDDQHNNGLRGLTIRAAHEPMFTVSAGQTKRSLRAAIPGRVVAMTPRCGARFQTFPDWYNLPDRNALAWRGIGNAMPPLAMQRICEGLLR